MCRFLTAVMALLLALTNIVLAADMHAEAFSERHHPEAALHADDHDGEQHPQCHHCCHAQGHLSSLPQAAHFWSMPAGHDWSVMVAVRPHSQGYAPPVPPPKA